MTGLPVADGGSCAGLAIPRRTATRRSAGPAVAVPALPAEKGADGAGQGPPKAVAQRPCRRAERPHTRRRGNGLATRRAPREPPRTKEHYADQLRLRIVPPPQGRLEGAPGAAGTRGGGAGGRGAGAVSSLGLAAATALRSAELSALGAATSISFDASCAWPVPTSSRRARPPSSDGREVTRASARLRSPRSSCPSCTNTWTGGPSQASRGCCHERKRWSAESPQPRRTAGARHSTAPEGMTRAT